MMICISVKGRTLDEVISKIMRVRGEEYLLEVRLDYLRWVSGLDILRPYRERLILTYRDDVRLSREEKLALYNDMLSLEPRYIDVDIRDDVRDEVIDAAKRTSSSVILSYHNFRETPELRYLLEIESGAYELGADVAKIVTLARRVEDNLVIFRLLSDASMPIVAFCMGRLGRISRIFSPFFGSLFTYASVSRDEHTAPGQVTYREIEEVWGIISAE